MSDNTIKWYLYTIRQRVMIDNQENKHVTYLTKWLTQGEQGGAITARMSGNVEIVDKVEVVVLAGIGGLIAETLGGQTIMLTDDPDFTEPPVSINYPGDRR